MDRYSVDREHTGVVSKSATQLICVSPYWQNMRQFKTVILSTRTVRNKTCHLILKNQGFFFVFSPNWQQSFISQAVRGSHVANAVQQQEYHRETLGGGEVKKSSVPTLSIKWKLLLIIGITKSYKILKYISYMKLNNFPLGLFKYFWFWFWLKVQ